MMRAHPAASRVLVAALLVGALGGCSTIKGWFGGKKADEKPTEPAELIDITPTVSVAKLWSANAGKGEGRLGLQQTPVVDGGRVYAAAVEGGVRAFDLQTGKQVWQYKSDLRFSGGPGAGQGLVVVGTLDGQVVALDATTGAEKWQAKVPNEVVAAPPLSRVHRGRPEGPSMATVSFLKLVAYTVVPSSTGAPSTSAMRSSSLRPSGVPTAWVHISRPSLADSAVRVPSSLPTNRTPGPTSTGALPRTVRLGSSLVQNQRRCAGVRPRGHRVGAGQVQRWRAVVEHDAGTPFADRTHGPWRLRRSGRL